MQEFNSIDPIGSIYQNSFNKLQLRRPTSKLVNIVCYCLNSNHYHMILEQRVNGGISEFMKRLSGCYTKHFNFKHKRSGVLFQGKFKANHIDSNEYLLHASAYVNLNGFAHQLKDNQFRSSWCEFINMSHKHTRDKNIILDQFKNRNEYKSFAKDTLKNILAR